MREIHPFGDFVPKKTKYLMRRSFVTEPTNPYDWFYANGRNQFLPIMEVVYARTFDTKEGQQQQSRSIKNLFVLLSVKIDL